MEFLERSLPEAHKIYLVGDKHEGNILKYNKGVQEVVEKVMEEKNSYVIEMGDLVEAITVDDPRYNPETVDIKTALPLLQYRAAINEMLPMKSRIITQLLGNHDWKLARTGNYVKDLVCHDLNVPYGTWSCKVSILDRKGNTRYKIYVTHGSWTVNSRNSDPLARKLTIHRRVKSNLRDLTGDCLIMAHAHCHKLVVVPPSSVLYLVDNGKDIIQGYTGTETDLGEYIHPDHRWYASTGSFLRSQARGISTYAEIRGYPPIELGYPIIHYDRGEINIERVIIGQKKKEGEDKK